MSNYNKQKNHYFVLFVLLVVLILSISYVGISAVKNEWNPTKWVVSEQVNVQENDDQEEQITGNQNSGTDEQPLKAEI